ncbi:MAG: TIGR04076 family protein [Firmicutes bacterium]|nr:TIGR04076 family protein [Bacillota bacterium]
MGLKDLMVEVISVKGKCPVYSVGDRFILRDGYRIEASARKNICVHSLGSVMPWVVALSSGVRPHELGLAHPNASSGYVQCLDPSAPYTPGETVTFCIKEVGENG